MSAEGDGRSAMRSEIAEQPRVVERTLDAVRPAAFDLAERMSRDGIRAVVAVGRGSSGNAAVYACDLLSARCGLRAWPQPPSLHAGEPAGAGRERALVLAFSQSGETPEIASVLERARRGGALTAAVTSHGDSPLAGCADVALVTAAGEERSIAATKSFTAELAAAAVLAAALGAHAARDALELVAPAMTRTLERAAGEPVERAAPLFAARPDAACVASGFGLSVALEAALKLKEVARIWAEGMSAAELRHGPIAAMAQRLALVFDCNGSTNGEVDALTLDLERAGARTLTVGQRGQLPAETSGLPDELMPFTLILPAQLVAERVARLRDLDPDRPQGLSKVTVTT